MAHLKDITKQQFGLLTAIQPTDKRTAGGSIIWECRCKCGNIKLIGANNLPFTKSCGCLRKRKGPQHHAWKNIKKYTNQGYVLVYITDKTYPGEVRKSGYVLEHEYVMVKHLGRALFPNEQIHHKNGNRANNQIDNLELWASSHPSGQRIKDLKTWAHTILSRYPD
jgi:hypothetical protein